MFYSYKLWRRRRKEEEENTEMLEDFRNLKIIVNQSSGGVGSATDCFHYPEISLLSRQEHLLMS